MWVYIHVALTITGVRVCVTAIISGVRFYSALHGPKIAGPMKLQPYPAQPVKIIKILAWPGPVNRKPSPAQPGPSMPSPQKTHTRQTTACTPWTLT